MAKTDLTAERLRELLNYDAGTGLFTWRVSRRSFRGKAKIGTIAGTPHGNGYIAIGIDGNTYFAHRLAWFYVYGAWPKLIDHENQCRSDNWIDNLRVATSVQNGLNAKARNPRSGIKGVQPLPSGRWRAVIKNNYKIMHLGCYATKEEAQAARQAAEDKIFKHEAFLLQA